mgnify:CR=1 FL=1
MTPRGGVGPPWGPRGSLWGSFEAKSTVKHKQNSKKGPPQMGPPDYLGGGSE